MHLIMISSIITKAGIPDIQEIKKIGRGKILIETKSALAANRLVDNPAFPKHNLKALSQRSGSSERESFRMSPPN